MGNVEKMRIGIFSWRDIKNPQAGGSELYFHELAKFWVKWGHEVTFFCGGWKDCKKKEIVDGIRIIRSGNALTQYFFSPIEYKKIKQEIDLILDVENGIPFFTPLFSKKKRFLHIHHVHKDVWFKQLPFPLAIIGWFLEAKIMPLIYRNVPVITISKSSAEEIFNEMLTKFYPEVITPGIEFYKYDKVQKSKKPSILFLNRIKKYKGIDIFLNAVKELKNQNFEEFDVWVAGSGDYSKKMEEYAKKNKLNNVKFLGRVSESKKQELMQKAWVFVNPSFKEGWGIVNIEANYFGTPVIGSDIGGIKDSVVDGKTGFLFKYGDYKEFAKKIRQMLGDKKLREKMGLQGEKWAKTFSWEKKSKEYISVLEKENSWFNKHLK